MKREKSFYDWMGGGGGRRRRVVGGSLARISSQEEKGGGGGNEEEESRRCNKNWGTEGEGRLPRSHHSQQWGVEAAAADRRTEML